MQMRFIPLDRLSVSAANMRAGRKPPDIADILPSVRARGILVPLLVRPVDPTADATGDGADADRFEIVAGRRRYFAARAAAADDDGKPGEPLPCAIIEAGDDAAALEASLIENVARLAPHEVEQWTTFTRLVREGRRPGEIAATFGLTEHQVKQVLALGNLLPRIRDLYRREEIDAATVRHLTLAPPKRQKEWLGLLDDPDCCTPTGQRLKAWLFGGASISTRVALFDLEAYQGAIVADLFGEEGYFADADAFWEAQDAAIAARREAYLAAGWSEVVTLGRGDYFQSWDHERTPKRKGGKVYIAVSQRGEVAFHEGYLSGRDARARSRSGGEVPPKPVRPEITATMQTYVDLHRHAAVREAMLGHPGVALRLMAAHAIAGSYLFAVRPEPQRGGSEAVAESVETCLAETRFDAARRGVLALLGFDPETPHVVGGADPMTGVAGVFARMLALGDEDVLSVIAIVMGEALEAGSAAAEAAGLHLGVDMAPLWSADETFFDLLRDRQVLTAIVAEVAGAAIANANAGETAKALKAVIRDCLEGSNGRAEVEGWVPRWMAFPPAAYTERGGVRSVARHAEIAELFAGGEAEPEGDGAPDQTPPAETEGATEATVSEPLAA